MSERLPKLTAIQRAYAFRHCFKHYAIKRADGTNICTECGHSWRSEHDLADTVCGCTCPHCGMELEAFDRYGRMDVNAYMESFIRV